LETSNKVGSILTSKKIVDVEYAAAIMFYIRMKTWCFQAWWCCSHIFQTDGVLNNKAVFLVYYVLVLRRLWESYKLIGVSVLCLHVLLMSFLLLCHCVLPFFPIQSRMYSLIASRRNGCPCDLLYLTIASMAVPLSLSHQPWILVPNCLTIDVVFTSLNVSAAPY